MAASEDSPAPALTPAKTAEHIRALNAINEDIPALLHAAGTAIAALTTRPLAPSSSSTPLAPLDAHKLAFTAAATRYFSAVARVDGALKAQVRALAAAGVVPAEPPRLGLGDVGEGVANGGLGGLDPGWLNARVGGGEKGMEGELLRVVRALLEGEIGAREGEGEGERVERV